MVILYLSTCLVTVLLLNYTQIAEAGAWVLKTNTSKSYTSFAQYHTVFLTEKYNIQQDKNAIHKTSYLFKQQFEQGWSEDSTIGILTIGHL